MNQTVSKKYKLEDLQVGMTVKLSEINEIYDTHMMLENSKLLANKDVEGMLILIGNDQEEYTKLFMQKRRLTPVYFSSEELVDGVVYDE